MSADRVQRRAEILDLIAEAGLALALDLKDAALAAETVEAKAAAAAEFHRVTRGVRQSLALEERFERNVERAAREAEAGAAARAEAAVRVRKAQVRAAVERRIYEEVEGHDARERLEDLTDRLDDEALFDDFTDEALEAHVERLAAGVGLTGQVRHDYIPRALRQTHAPTGVDWGELMRHFREEADDDGYEEDDDADLGHDTRAAALRSTAPTRIAEPPEPPAQAEPPPEPLPEPLPPPPEPPPKPYIPPWERLGPGESFPGGSGW
jgi:hypothetical protein